MGAPFAAGGPPVGAPSVPFCAARLACFSAFALFLSSAGESFSSSAGLGASFAGSDIVSGSVRGFCVDVLRSASSCAQYFQVGSRAVALMMSRKQLCHSIVGPYFFARGKMI
jgi:hypothetical protein